MYSWAHQPHHRARWWLSSAWMLLLVCFRLAGLPVTLCCAIPVDVQEATEPRVSLSVPSPPPKTVLPRWPTEWSRQSDNQTISSMPNRSISWTSFPRSSNMWVRKWCVCFRPAIFRSKQCHSTLSLITFTTEANDFRSIFIFIGGCFDRWIIPYNARYRGFGNNLL